MPQFSKVSAGQSFSFPAPFYNTLVDVATAFENAEGLGGVPGLGSLMPGVIWGENKIGEDLDSGEVVALGDASNPPSGSDQGSIEFSAVFEGIHMIELIEPELPRDLGRWCITLDPIDDDDVGRVAIAGCWPVQVYVNLEEHRYCDLIALDIGSTPPGSAGSTGSAMGNIVLATAHAGAGRILWKEPDHQGEYAWAYVHFPCYVPQLYEATTDVDTDDNTIQGKPLMVNGALTDAPGGGPGTGSGSGSEGLHYTFDVLYDESTEGS